MDTPSYNRINEIFPLLLPENKELTSYSGFITLHVKLIFIIYFL